MSYQKLKCACLQGYGIDAFREDEKKFLISAGAGAAKARNLPAFRSLVSCKQPCGVVQAGLPGDDVPSERHADHQRNLLGGHQQHPECRRGVPGPVLYIRDVLDTTSRLSEMLGAACGREVPNLFPNDEVDRVIGDTRPVPEGS